MTDKQIIQYKKECFEEPYCSLKEVLEELSRKEQECEELKKQNDCNCLDSCCKKQQLDQLKAENKHLNDLLNNALKELEKARENLTGIKEIAEFYNNSNMDDICYQDGIYEILQKISECEVE